MPEDWQRVVAVVAHPDDLEYGAASAIARWTSPGKAVSYVLATSGEAGIAGTAPSETGPLRQEEERRSAAVVGVSHVEFLGHPDGLVEQTLDVSATLELGIASLRQHAAYLTGLGWEFDPAEFLRNIAGFDGLVAGCEYAVTLQRFSVR
ncbi:MAG: PIG-L family deacetylase [Actinomycetota bacterium]|nr:PIG-L family deacetylase [Actinomycetota bacterium]